MVTMRDVADRAGVSSKTVSRVFRNEQYVSEAVRQRVTAAMRELNFVPNMLARTFREGRASILGIAVPSIADPFFAAIIEAADAFAATRDHAIAVTSLGSEPGRERPVVEALLRRQISGLLIAPIAPDQSYLKPWLEQAPIVFIDREPTGIDGDVFLEDDCGGAALAVQHLIELGHRRIAFLGANDAVVTTERRLEGYRKAHRAAGIPVDDELVLFAGPQQVGKLLARAVTTSDPPTAVFSSNSRTSLEIIPTLQELGRRDLALVSFGDFPMAGSLDPSVTVIDQNPLRLGRAAAERAFQRLDQTQSTLARRTVFDVTPHPAGLVQPWALTSAGLALVDRGRERGLGVGIGDPAGLTFDQADGKHVAAAVAPARVGGAVDDPLPGELSDEDRVLVDHRDGGTEHVRHREVPEGGDGQGRYGPAPEPAPWCSARSRRTTPSAAGPARP